MINSGKIKGRIVECGLTQKDVAKALHLATPTVCQKLNGSRPMTLEEAETLADILGIGNSEFGVYFFKC